MCKESVELHELDTAVIIGVDHPKQLSQLPIFHWNVLFL